MHGWVAWMMADANSAAQAVHGSQYALHQASACILCVAGLGAEINSLGRSQPGRAPLVQPSVVASLAAASLAAASLAPAAAAAAAAASLAAAAAAAAASFVPAAGTEAGACVATVLYDTV